MVVVVVGEPIAIKSEIGGGHGARLWDQSLSNPHRGQTWWWWILATTTCGCCSVCVGLGVATEGSIKQLEPPPTTANTSINRRSCLAPTSIHKKGSRTCLLQQQGRGPRSSSSVNNTHAHEREAEAPPAALAHRGNNRRRRVCFIALRKSLVPCFGHRTPPRASPLCGSGTRDEPSRLIARALNAPGGACAGLESGCGWDGSLRSDPARLPADANVDPLRLHQPDSAGPNWHGRADQSKAAAARITIYTHIHKPPGAPTGFLRAPRSGTRAHAAAEKVNRLFAFGVVKSEAVWALGGKSNQMCPCVCCLLCARGWDESGLASHRTGARCPPSPSSIPANRAADPTQQGEEQEDGDGHFSITMAEPSTTTITTAAAEEGGQGQAPAAAAAAAAVAAATAATTTTTTPSSPSGSRAGSPVSLASAGSALLGAEVLASRDISKVSGQGG